MDGLIGSVLGWIGTVGTFSAYVLIWRGWLDSSAMRYSVLNAAGGFMAAIGAFAYGAWPAFGSNLVWGAIGVHGIIVALRRKAAASKAAAAHTPMQAFSPSGIWSPDITDALPISLPWLPKAGEAGAASTPEAHEVDQTFRSPARWSATELQPHAVSQ